MKAVGIHKFMNALQSTNEGKFDRMRRIIIKTCKYTTLYCPLQLFLLFIPLMTLLTSRNVYLHEAA